MNPEKYKALLKLFNGDAALIDELLASQQAVLRGTDKAYIGDVRRRFKALGSSGGDDFLAGPSAWLIETGGRGCL